MIVTGENEWFEIADWVVSRFSIGLIWRVWIENRLK
jgi:hypothetical protein